MARRSIARRQSTMILKRPTYEGMLSSLPARRKMEYIVEWGLWELYSVGTP